jgi:hypothetical protein
VDGTTGSAVPDNMGKHRKKVKKGTATVETRVTHLSIINTSKVPVGDQLKELV